MTKACSGPPGHLAHLNSHVCSAVVHVFWRKQACRETSKEVSEQVLLPGDARWTLQAVACLSSGPEETLQGSKQTAHSVRAHGSVQLQLHLQVCVHPQQNVEGETRRVHEA